MCKWNGNDIPPSGYEMQIFADFSYFISNDYDRVTREESVEYDRIERRDITTVKYFLDSALVMIENSAHTDMSYFLQETFDSSLMLSYIVAHGDELDDLDLDYRRLLSEGVTPECIAKLPIFQYDGNKKKYSRPHIEGADDVEHYFASLIYASEARDAVEVEIWRDGDAVLTQRGSVYRFDNTVDEPIFGRCATDFLERDHLGVIPTVALWAINNQEL